VDIPPPAVFDAALDEAIRLQISPDDRQGRRDAGEVELSSVTLEIEWLVAAISAATCPALVAALQQKDRRRQDCAAARCRASERAASSAVDSCGRSCVGG
jgi:hypothetical protein